MDHGSTTAFEPSQTLRSRTFIGLLLAQFTATFNDQTTHIVAIFYASDMLVRFVGLPHVDEKAVVSIVTACFIAPFLLFSSYAGILADKFSKRTIIVFWKVAEVLMMLLVLAGLSLPHFADQLGVSLPTIATVSAVIVVSCVLLMGFHSTFFVPAKYGAMPEILHPSILSRGNGLLEGTSFMAQIFGTSAGGILYAILKSKVEPGVLVPGREWLIGVLLVGLASLGTFTAVLMERIPIAAPHRVFSWNWVKPLRENLRILWGSKPLTLAVLGIAFAAYMTLFVRQSLLYEGEIDKELQAVQAHVQEAAHPTTTSDQIDAAPANHWTKWITDHLGSAAQQAELRVSLQIALVGFGVGLGSLLAGYLSGQRVELGLVPFGCAGMMILSLFLGIWMRSVVAVTVFLFLVGAAAGVYIVPLYTLLQHRAPKESKGNVIAASNFLNVVGGVIAVALFYLTTLGLEAFFGPELRMKNVQADLSLADKYMEQLNRQRVVPQLLFMATSLFVGWVLLFLCRRLPDFVLRAGIWWNSLDRRKLRVIGLDHLPGDGPVVLATNCADFDAALQVIASTDRFTEVILVEQETPGRHAAALLRFLARRMGMITLRASGSTPAEWDRALAAGTNTLARRDIVALSVTGIAADDEINRLLHDWQLQSHATIVPVYCSADIPDTRVVIGSPLGPHTALADARTALTALTHIMHDPHHEVRV